MNIFTKYGFVIPCIDHLEHISPLTYMNISNGDTFHSKIKIITSVSITTDLIGKVLCIEKQLNYGCRYIFSNILFFLNRKLESMIGKRYPKLCPWSNSLTSFVIKQVSAQYTGWNNHSLLVILPGRTRKSNQCTLHLSCKTTFPWSNY